MRINLRRVSLSIIIAILAIPMALPATAKVASRNPAAFDGNWSVLIITDDGPCDRAYRYGFNIESGQLRSNGLPGVAAAGQVSANGSIRVSLRRGDSYAVGSGRLVGMHGTGRWSGASTTKRCAGHWEAERRPNPA